MGQIAQPVPKVSTTSPLEMSDAKEAAGYIVLRISKMVLNNFRTQSDATQFEMFRRTSGLTG